MDNLVTPVKADVLEHLLNKTGYDKEKTKFLVDGFKHGFDLGYRGPEQVQLLAPNLKFVIGNKLELWNKVMKEVELGRYAGPFRSIPFDNYIQSPIGLVPKDGGTKTRLIFHLSYPKDGDTSINANTPKEISTVEYPKLEQAVLLCLRAGKGCSAGKSDLSAAFRHLCIAKKFWKFLVMKAYHPITNELRYFVDKCLPFGASISCSNFQKFSDALSYIVEKLTGGIENVNYLDDYFFVALLKAMCDRQITTFLQVCGQINFPVSMEKTCWGQTQITFLGLLIDTVRQIICIPLDKLNRALDMIDKILTKRGKKLKLRELQQLCGFLNFLCKAIVPGRVFTRRMYTYGAKLTKPDHHFTITQEFKSDLRMWQEFLKNPIAYSRPFLDVDANTNSIEVDWATDASANPNLGAGGTCFNEWFILQWDEKFMLKNEPSINYLELYAVAVGIFLWLGNFKNQRITIFCDNMSVVHMINTNVSTSKNCMVLLRFIVLQSLIHNVKITAKHIVGKFNIFPDLLSRLQYGKFRQIARKNGRMFTNKSREIPEVLWPMEKIWLHDN